jgi:hypothetical protein
VKGSALQVIVILILVSLVTVLRTLPPRPLPASAPATVFSAERAAEHIHRFAQAPRPTGSPANAQTRNYILETLKNLGLETETQQVWG